MENLLNFVIALIILFFLYQYFERKSYDINFVKSEIDDKEYLVRNMDDSQEAANLLAKTRQKLEKVNNYLYNLEDEDLEKFLDENDDLETVRENINRMNSRFRPDNLSEATPHEKHTSYSVNKGEKIVFCLRDKDENENLVNENTIIFVALHELAHVMTKSVGHTDEFWHNFQFLLKVAVKLKLYHNHNYNDDPVEYCGTTITDTPLKKKDEIKNTIETSS